MKLHLLLLLTIITSSYGYHILVVVPAPSHSHNTLGKGIVDALLNARHTVTWATPYPEKVKNPPKTLNILDISSVQRFMAGIDMGAFISNQRISLIKELAKNITIDVLTSPAIQEALIKQQYDAVITEQFLSDPLAGIAAVQQIPWIVFASTQMFPNLEAQIDEVRSVATIPLMFNPTDIPMSFTKRAVNAFIYIAMTVSGWFDRPDIISTYENLFAPIAAARGVPLPPFDDAFYNVSIMFVNSHESLTPVFSSPPNVINIAGYHMDDVIPPLPKDLQDLLDGSPQGVIYFSMGSVLKSADLKPKTRDELLKLFSSLPYTVLWKFEEQLTGLPSNVHIRSWMPQPSILAHKNIKVFITHGGQLSSLEAVRAGVPLLAVPVFGDQPANADRAVRRGYALKVTFAEDMAAELGVALKEMLSNDKYSKQVKLLSHLFMSRPTSPKHLINHYVTLAIESKGAHHLRSLSLKYKWYERWMLDFTLVLLLALAALFKLLKVLVKKILRLLLGKKTSNVKHDKKKRV